MLSRHNKNVARIHRLNVHEREGVGVFVTNRGLPSAVNQVAEAAMHVGLTHLALTVGVGYARLNADRMPRSGPGETAGRRGRAWSTGAARRCGSRRATLRRRPQETGEVAGLWPHRRVPSARAPAGSPRDN